MNSIQTNDGGSDKGALLLFRRLKKVHYRVSIILVLLLVLAGVNGYILSRMNQIEKEYDEIKVTAEESKIANQAVLSALQEIKQKQEEREREIAYQKMLEQQHENQILQLKATGFSIDTDITKDTDIKAEDMDRIIAYYDSHIKGGTGFTGKGYVFVEASKKTGINPVYLFAHAATESSYGKSYYARTRGNYFGINAVDGHEDRASNLGSDVDEGIVNGAMWIKHNYVDHGYTTLREMHKAGYASDKDWASTISSVANTSLEVL